MSSDRSKAPVRSISASARSTRSRGGRGAVEADVDLDRRRPGRLAHHRLDGQVEVAHRLRAVVDRRGPDHGQGVAPTLRVRGPPRRRGWRGRRWSSASSNGPLRAASTTGSYDDVPASILRMARLHSWCTPVASTPAAAPWVASVQSRCEPGSRRAARADNHWAAAPSTAAAPVRAPTTPPAAASPSSGLAPGPSVPASGGAELCRSLSLIIAAASPSGIARQPGHSSAGSRPPVQRGRPRVRRASQQPRPDAGDAEAPGGLAHQAQTEHLAVPPWQQAQCEQSRRHRRQLGGQDRDLLASLRGQIRRERQQRRDSFAGEREHVVGQDREQVVGAGGEPGDQALVDPGPW